MTISEKQFEDAFTAAGGWFIVTQFELIKTWTGSRSDLVDLILTKGFDAKRTGSSTRVTSTIRIIEGGAGREALEKIRDSVRINHEHPDAERMAKELLIKYYQ